VSKLLKLFTELDLEEIAEIEKQNINLQKEKLAYEATKICHGEEEAKAAIEKAKNIFNSKDNQDINLLPEKNIVLTAEEIAEGKALFAILRDCELCASGKEAKRLIKGGAVKINDRQI